VKIFEFIEHTADIGVRVFGRDLEELFKNSATALFGIILDYHPQSSIKEEIVLEAESLEEILVTWLNELLSLFSAYNFLPANYNISIGRKNEIFFLNAIIYGENFDYNSTSINTEIKAATYHDLKIEKKDDLYIAEIIFDV